MSSEGKENAGASASEKKSNDDVCRDYLRNVCNRGANCKFYHPKDAVKKLEFCHDYQNSICKRHNCKFVHCSRAAEEYYHETGSMPEGFDEMGKRSRYNQYGSQEIPLCVDFLNGKCRRGVNCKFRHQSQGDLQYEQQKMGMGMGGMDEYEFDRMRRPMLPSMRRFPGAARMLADMFEGSSLRTARDLEEENILLKATVEELRKQVSDLTATNEVLLEQNARMRTGKQGGQFPA